MSIKASGIEQDVLPARIVIDRCELARAEQTLVVRPMTDEERAHYGPAVPRGKKPFMPPPDRRKRA